MGHLAATGEFRHLARRVEQARRGAIAHHLPPGILDGVVELSSDWALIGDRKQRAPAMKRHLDAERAIAEAERRHARTVDNKELHTIAVEVADEELLAIREQADSANEAAQIRVHGRELNEDEALELMQELEGMELHDPHNETEADLMMFRVTTNIIEAIDQRSA